MRFLLLLALLQADDGLDKLKDAVVQKALKLEADSAAPADCGAAWAAASVKVAKTHKSAAVARATRWYVQAWGAAAEGERLKLRASMSALAGVPDGALAPPKAPGSAQGWDWLGPCVVDGTFWRSGKASAKITPSNGKTPDGRSGVSCTLFPVTPGMEYEATVWAYPFWSDADLSMDFHYFDIKGALVTSGGSILLPRDEPWWHKLEVKVTIPAGVARGRVVVGGKFASGVVWVDDVEVTTGGKPLTIKNAGFEER